MTELLAKNSANSCTNAVKSVTKDLETLSDSNPVGPLRQASKGISVEWLDRQFMTIFEPFFMKLMLVIKSKCHLLKTSETFAFRLLTKTVNL